MAGPSFLLGQTHCKPAADLGPTGQAAVREMGSATFLAARVAQVRSSPRQLGQPWQMLPLEQCWKFITKHIGILGCSWLRFSGVADEALSLNQNTSSIAESHNSHLLLLHRVVPLIGLHSPSMYPIPQQLYLQSKVRCWQKEEKSQFAGIKCNC